jgi:hypothetical protein
MMSFTFKIHFFADSKWNFISNRTIVELTSYIRTKEVNGITKRRQICENDRWSKTEAMIQFDRLVERSCAPNIFRTVRRHGSNVVGYAVIRQSRTAHEKQ